MVAEETACKLFAVDRVVLYPSTHRAPPHRGEALSGRWRTATASSETRTRPCWLPTSSTWTAGRARSTSLS